MTKARRRRTETGAPKEATKRETGTVKVFRSYSANGAVLSEDEGIEELEVKTFLSEPAYLSVNHGVTKNLGSYESMRLDVRVSIPCYPAEVNEALLYADKLAKDFLDDSVDQYITEIK